jgi:hypothetical protein
MTDTILQITTNLSNRVEKLSQLAFLTIATGTFRRPEIIHNLYKEDGTETLGLIGQNRRAAIVEINVQQFFAQKNDTVPTMDYFKTLTTNNSSTPPTPRAAHLTQLPIPHSIALPSRSCDWLLSLSDLTVHSAYDRVLRDRAFFMTRSRDLASDELLETSLTLLRYTQTKSHTR